MHDRRLDRALSRREKIAAPAGAHRYGVALVLTSVTLAFVLAAPSGDVATAVSALLTGFTIGEIVWTSGARRAVRRAAAVVILLTVIGAILVVALGTGRKGIPEGLSGLMIFAAVPIAGSGVVRLVRERGGVTLQAVAGAIVVYLLAGLLFAFAYGVLADFSSSPIFTNGGDGTPSDRLYFSLTALTTTGFGDFVMATRLGRSISVLEALLGQLYLVTVLAVFVGNLRTARTSRPPPPGDGG